MPNGSTSGNSSMTSARSKRSATSCDARLDLLRRQAVEARMQIEVLPDGELRVEGEGLGHVADAAAEAPCRSRPFFAPNSVAVPSVGGSRPVSIFIVVLLPEPFDPRKPKISALAMRKLTWSTAMKIAEPLGQTFCFDGDFVRRRSRARRDDHVQVALAFLFGQKRDERGVEGILSCARRGVPLVEPVASTLPAYIATSQSNRAASSMYAVATMTLMPGRTTRI